MQDQHTTKPYMQAPSVERAGISFYPTPDVSDVEIAFGADAERYFGRNVDSSDIPAIFTQAADAYFAGTPMGNDFMVDQRADAAKMRRMFQALATSFGPKIEDKIATMAFALWVWASPDTITAYEAAQPVESVS